MRQLEMTCPMLEQTQQLLALLLYPHLHAGLTPATLNANRMGQSGLWQFGISGDLPILLLHMNDEAEAELLQELLRAHTYWRRRGLGINLVILNRQSSNYGLTMQDFIQRMIQRTENGNWLNQRWGIFVADRRSDQ